MVENGRFIISSNSQNKGIIINAMVTTRKEKHLWARIIKEIRIRSIPGCRHRQKIIYSKQEVHDHRLSEEDINLSRQTKQEALTI